LFALANPSRSSLESKQLRSIIANNALAKLQLFF